MEHTNKHLIIETEHHRVYYSFEYNKLYLYFQDTLTNVKKCDKWHKILIKQLLNKGV